MLDVLKNINIEDINKHLDKIPSVIAQIKEKLPLVDGFEKSLIAEHKLKENTIFLYSATKIKDKIMIFVFAGYTLNKTIEVDGIKLVKGTLIIEKQIKSFDLFEFAEQIHKDGINGLIDLLIL